MIKIENKTMTMSGNMIEIFIDFGCFFEAINAFFDKKDLYDVDVDLEKFFVSDEKTLKEFCKLAVRLNEAHNRFETEEANQWMT